MTEKVMYSVETTETRVTVPRFRSYPDGRYCLKLTAQEIQDDLLLTASEPVYHYFTVPAAPTLQLTSPTEIYIRVD